jgi:hypothetical protein
VVSETKIIKRELKYEQLNLIKSYDKFPLFLKKYPTTTSLNEKILKNPNI